MRITKRHSLPEALKHDFMLMEAYFHGRSSGLDPLVSFLNQALLVSGDGRISLPLVKMEEFPFSIRLIDTGCTGATSPLVSLFIHKMQNPEFKDVFDREYLPANDGAIGAFLQGSTEDLFSYLQQITVFQLNYLPEMIPEVFRRTIEQMLSQGIPVKLLGSGGGGYLLAFVRPETDPGLLANTIRVF
jgi:mevalonate kinase